jgi:hypothetical protein
MPTSSSTWFTTTDQLAGTEKIGNSNDNNNEWALLFDKITTFPNFLVTTNDFRSWFIASKSSIQGNTGTETELDIVSSSLLSNPTKLPLN